MGETTKLQNWFDVLAAFIEGKMLFADGSRPDDADRMIAIGIVLAFEKARQQTGIINEELLRYTCARFFGNCMPVMDPEQQ